MMHVIAKHFTPVTLIGVLTSVWSAAVAASPKRICGADHTAEKAVILEVSTGWVSGCYPYKGHSVEADIDESTATIKVSGRFDYGKPKGHSVTRDCMGHRPVKLKLSGVEARRYRAATDRGFTAILDLAADRNRSCIGKQREVASVIHPPFVRNLVTQLLPNTSGQTVQEIMAPLLKQVAVAHEGFGSLSLNIYKLGNGKITNRAVAEIKALDLVDDSVAGLHFTVLLRSTGQAWKALSVRRRSLCARGRHAGQWTDDQCS